MNQQDQFQRVTAVLQMQQSRYDTLDVGQTLEYMNKRFIQPMARHLDLSTSNLTDCGAGFGWLAFAFLLQGGQQALLADIDCRRLEAAREIADILNVIDRCEFICCPMQELQLAEDSVDIFASVETLEHVGEEHIDACIQLIATATREMVILTTPNKFFPIVWHDTRVPLAHWFPPHWRRYYVRLFGKQDVTGNQFVNPRRLKPVQHKFKPSSEVLTFATYEDWLASYPFESPYGWDNRWRERPALALKILYRSASSLFGRHSYFVSPNLCRLWLRR